MNDILKQRLVGALVIVVLAVIFWPLIFVGPEGDPLDRSTQVPSIPSLRQMQLDAPEPLQGVAPVQLPSGASVSEVEEAASMASADAVSRALEDNFDPVAESASAMAEGSLPMAEGSSPVAENAQSEAAPRLDQQGIPIAWTLQVVSVAKQEKAEILVQQLLDMGYTGYFKAVRHGDGTLYRVFIGPKFEKGKMQEAKLVVDKKFRVNSIVTRYYP